MSTATKEWTFNGGLESWVGNAGSGDVTMQYQAGDTDPSDGTGCLESRLVGKNKNNIISYWEITDTIANIFGIPEAATINSIGDNNLDHVHSTCTEWTTGDSPYDGGFELWDNVTPAIVGTFWSALAFSATFAWTTTNRTCGTIDVSGLSWTGATTIRLRLYNTLDTGNDNNAAITLRNDSIRLTVDYTSGSTPYQRSIDGGFSGSGDLKRGVDAARPQEGDFGGSGDLKRGLAAGRLQEGSI